MPTVSLSMVVKDEAATLAGAINSVKDVVDEVVIGVDDSCTDNTAEIARHYASPGKYFEFTWNENFSAARNEAIKRCDGDLVYIMDGHEFLPPDEHPTPMQLSRMRHIDVYSHKVLTPTSFMEQIRENGFDSRFDVMCHTLAMNTDRWGIPMLFFLQPRIFRNHKGIHYESAVHNHLAGYNREMAMGCPEAILIHNMPKEREEKRRKQRGKMNFSGLMRDVRRERKKPIAEQNARPWFYMGNSHADLGHSEKAIYWYEQYLKRSKFGEELYQAYQQLAVLYHRHRNDNNRALEYGMMAMRTQFRRAEPYLLLGEISLEMKDYDQALHWFGLARQIPAPHTVMFLQGPVYSFVPDIQKMKCNEAMENWNEAIRYAETVLSWRPGDPVVIDKINEYKGHATSVSATRKPNMLIADSLMSFSGEIANHFSNKYDVRYKQTVDDLEKGWAEIAWFEWCDKNIIEWSRKEWKCPVVCRLHSYEAFTDMPDKVMWENVDHIVFVAHHIRELFFMKWPHLRQIHDRTSVIPNGVNMDKWTFKERGHGKRIGYAGHLNPKKGIDLLLMFAHMLPDYEFHIVGRIQDNHIAYDFSQQVAEMNNVWYQDEIPNEQMDDWMDEIDYLISPSVVESFGYSIAEAMSKGIKPLIRNRPGAIWMDTWRTPEDLRAMLEGPYDSHAYRNHIHDHYRLEIQLIATERLVQYVMNDKRESRPDYPYDHEVLDMSVVE